MALSKTLVLDNGVTITYFRIDSLTFKTGNVFVVVGGYKTQALAGPNKKPVVTQTIEFNSSQFTKELVDSGQLFPRIYAAIKTFASGPSSVGDVLINKKYLDGEFEDA